MTGSNLKRPIADLFDQFEYSWKQDTKQLDMVIRELTTILNNNNELDSLTLAAKCGDVNSLRNQINSGILGNSVLTDNKMPFFAAVIFNQIPAFEELISLGGDVTQIDNNGNTPLMMAAYTGDMDMLKKITELKVDLNAVNCGGYSALMVAAYYGHLNIVQQLFKKGAMMNVKSNAGMTALMFAVAKSHFGVINYLVRYADVNLRDCEGNAPISIASSVGDLLVVKAITSSNADINVFNKFHKTPLMFANEGNHQQVVEFLSANGGHTSAKSDYVGHPEDELKVNSFIDAALTGDLEYVNRTVEQGCGVDDTDDRSRTPLMAACQGGHLSIVKFLIEQKANIDKTNNSGQTAFAYALQMHNKSIVEYLLKQYASVEVQDSEGRTVFIHCALSNDIELVRSMSVLGCDIFHKDTQGKSALMLASEIGFMEAAEFLVNHGLNIGSACSNQITALEYAFISDSTEVYQWFLRYINTMKTQTVIGQNWLLSAERGDKDNILRLLRLGIDVDYNIDVDNLRDTALTLASKNGHFDVVKTLLQHQALIDKRNTLGRTALFCAILRKHIEIAKLLIVSGACVNVVDRRGYYTPLMAVAQENFSEGCTLLLQHGAVPQRKDKNGLCALSHAVRHNSLEVVELLLYYGASVNAYDLEGHTPLVHAIIRQQFDMIKILVMNNADVNFQDSKGRVPLDAALCVRNNDHIHYLLQVGANHPKIPRSMLIDDNSRRKGEKIFQIEDIIKACAVAYKVELELKIKHQVIDKDSAEKPFEIQNVEEVMSSKQDEELCSENSSINFQERFYAVCCQPHFNIEEAHELLGKGIDINQKDSSGVYPLLIVSKQNQPQAIEWMVSNHADINFQNPDGRSALMYACQNGDLRIVKLLVNKHIKIDMLDNNKHTALFYAINHKRNLILEFLMQNGASVDLQDVNGTTPLHLSVQVGCKEIIESLIKAVAMVDVHDNKGYTPLFYCLLYSSQDTVNIMECLLENGCNIDNTDKSGETVLFMSVRLDILDISKYLISQGANINLTNIDGENLCTVTVAKGNLVFLQYLLTLGKFETSIVRTAMCMSLFNNDVTACNTIAQFCNLEADNICYESVAKLALEQNNVDLIRYLNENKLLRQPLDKNINWYECFAVDNEAAHTLWYSLYCGSVLYSGEVILVNMFDAGHYEQAVELLEQSDKESQSRDILTCYLIGETTIYEKSNQLQSDAVHLSGETTIYEKSNHLQSDATYMDGENSDDTCEDKDDSSENKHKHDDPSKEKNIVTMVGKLDKILKEHAVIVKENELLRKKLKTLESNQRQRMIPTCSCGQCHSKAVKGNLKKKIGFTKADDTYVYEDEFLRLSQQKANGNDDDIPVPLTSSNKEGKVCKETKRNFNIRTVEFVSRGSSYDTYMDMFLFKFHSTLSQDTLDGREVASTADPIIALLFAKYFKLHPDEVPRSGSCFPTELFAKVENAIREGNEIYDLNYKEKTQELRPEELSLLTSHLGIKFISQTDVDTRYSDSLVPQVMYLKPNQIILMVKNDKVISVVSCNNNDFIMLFDSHQHLDPFVYGNRMCGTFILLARKNQENIASLFRTYDRFCDPIPYHGKFLLFE